MIAFCIDSNEVETLQKSYKITQIFNGSIYELLTEKSNLFACSDQQGVKNIKSVLAKKYNSISDDSLIIALVLNEFNQRSIELELIDDTKPSDLDEYIQFVDKFNKFSSNIISFKTKLKLHELKSNKKKTGNIPWGFKLSQENTLVPDQYEQSVTNIIIDLKNQNNSIYRIAKILNEKQCRRRNGNSWGYKNVELILKHYDKYQNLREQVTCPSEETQVLERSEEM